MSESPGGLGFGGGEGEGGAAREKVFVDGPPSCGGWKSLGRDSAGIRSWTPRCGRSGRTRRPVTARHRSADGDKAAENEAFQKPD